MKAFAFSLAALFVVALFGAESAKAAGPKKPLISLGDQKLTPSPTPGKIAPGAKKLLPRRCIVRYGGYGKRCYLTKAAAAAFARQMRARGCYVRIQPMKIRIYPPRYCVTFRCPTKTRVFTSYLQARQFEALMKRLGFRTSLRCYPIFRPTPVGLNR